MAEQMKKPRESGRESRKPGRGGSGAGQVAVEVAGASQLGLGSVS
ncbi:hypothetical protein [Kibdelosporangium philippinense]